MKNFITFRQLDFAILKQTGLTEQDVPRSTRQAYVNNKLMKLYAALNWVNDPFFKRVTTLSVAADQELLKDSTDGGVVTAVNTTAKTITRSSGTFTAGSLIFVATADSTGAVYRQWIARIVTGGATATYELLSGTAGWIDGINVIGGSVIVLKTSSQTSVDLSAIYLDRILRVWDGSVSAERGFYLFLDGRAFNEVHRDPDMDTAVAAYHYGDTLQLKAGPDADALGVVQMEYRGKPNTYTDATEDNLVDMPPEQNQFLFDEVMAEYLKHAKKELPAELARRLGEYEEAYTAKTAELKKDADSQGKRSV